MEVNAITTNEDFEERPKKRRPPATTPEGRENQMISLAFDQAEKQMRNGTAPAPIVVHYLKLGTQQSKLELEKLKLEGQLLIKRAEQIDQAERMEELYAKAIATMVIYQGRGEQEDYDQYDDHDD